MYTLSRIPSVLSITCLMALSSASCTKKEPAKDEAAGEAAGEGAIVRAGDVSLPGGRLLKHDGVVLGHFALPNSSAMLGKVRGQLVIPQYQGVVDEAALRSLVGMSLEKRGQVAMNIDLAAPLGCAVADYKVYDVPVACAFGYRGGVKQLLTDLGETGKLSDAGGHVAAYNVEGKDVFIDTLGAHVVVSAHRELFAKTSGYLSENIIGRAEAMAGDVEVVAFVGQIWETYRSDLEPLLNMAAAAQGAPPQTGNPELDAVARKWSDYTATSTKESLKRFGQYEQATFYVQLGEVGVVVGGSVIPTEGSEAAAEAAQYGGRAIDPAVMRSLPARPVMLMGVNADPAAIDAPSTRKLLDMSIEIWASLTGKTAAEGRAAVDKTIAENRGLYDGQGAAAIFHQEGAPFAAAFTQRLLPGLSAREGWQAWSTRFTPAEVLGEKLSRYVSWTFTPEAMTIDGVPVDRWVITPSDEVVREFEGKLGEEERAQIERYFGPLRLTIDRAETGGSVMFTVAPKAEEAAMARTIAARKGQGSLADDAGLTTALARSPKAATVVAFDLGAGVEWLRSFPPIAAELKKLPGPLGNDLSDIYVNSHYLSSGAASVEYVVSQRLIEQFKAMAMK